VPYWSSDTRTAPVMTCCILLDSTFTVCVTFLHRIYMRHGCSSHHRFLTVGNTVHLSSSHSNTSFSACNLTTHRSQQHHEDSYGNETVPNPRRTEEYYVNTRSRIMWRELGYRPDCLSFNPSWRSAVPPRPSHSIPTERVCHTYATGGCSGFRTIQLQL